MNIPQNKGNAGIYFQQQLVPFPPYYLQNGALRHSGRIASSFIYFTYVFIRKRTFEWMRCFTWKNTISTGSWSNALFYSASWDNLRLWHCNLLGINFLLDDSIKFVEGKVGVMLQTHDVNASKRNISSVARDIIFTL